MVYSKGEKTDLLLELLVENCGNEEVEEFIKLDTSDVVFSKRYYRKRKRIINGSHYKPILISLSKALSRVAVVALVIFSLGVITVMSVPVLREKVVKMVVEWYDDHMEITHTDEDETTEEQAVPIIFSKHKPTTLPTDIEEEVLVDNPVAFICEYYVGDDCVATFKQGLLSESNKITIDTEGATIYNISIYERELLVSHGALGDIAIYWEDSEYTYVLIGTDLDLLLDLIKRIE